jgi:hypothetical protein
MTPPLRSHALVHATVFLAVTSAITSCSGQIDGRPPAPEPPGTTPDPGGGGGGSPPAAGPPCDPGAHAFAPARIWQLTDQQYVNVVRDVFGVTLTGDDARIASAGAAERYTNYSEGATIDTQVAPNYQTAALKVADLFEPRWPGVLGSAAPTPAQVQSFITNRVARAWRRPLTAVEVAGLTKIYVDAQPDGAARGVHLVVEAALQSPSFLYRTEIGTTAAAGAGPVRLTTFELASALSFLFLESGPDDALWGHAADGTLDDAGVLAAEVDRMMALPAARATLTARASYWLGLGGITNRSRSSLYPEWNESLKTALSQSVQHFVSDVITTGKLDDLFTSNRIYVNAQIARVYGIAGVAGAAAAVPGTQRSAGILTQPGFLVAANRTIDRTDVVHRGLTIKDAFICGGAIPPAPPEAGDEAKKLDGTERQRAQARASKPNCSPCHTQFDPLGLTLARYDALGRYDETKEAVLDSTTSMTSWQTSATPIDASAVILDDGQGGGLAGPVDGPTELAAKLVGARARVAACAARKLAEYSLGYNPDAVNSCELKAVKQVFIDTGSFAALFRALALSPGFRTRTPAP